MATRNDEKYLESCLDRIADAFDQVVVADVDSTDRSVQIARQHGALVVSSQQPDHFAEARNEAVSMARNPWILTLDADERLAPRDLVLLHTISRGAPHHAYRLPVRHYARRSTPFDRWSPYREEGLEIPGAGGWTTSFEVRIFPNCEDFLHHHRVCASVEPDLSKSGPPVHPAAVTVHRTRDLEEPGQRAARELHEERLLRRALRESVHSRPPVLELSRLLRRRGRWAEARAVLSEAATRFSGTLAFEVERALVSCLAKEYVESMAAAEAVLARDPRCYECWEALALSRLGAGRVQDAEVAAQRAIASGPKSPGGFHALGRCLMALEQPRAAVGQFRQALRFDPRHVPSLWELGRLAMDREDWTSAVGYLGRAVRNNEHDGRAAALLQTALAHHEARGQKYQTEEKIRL